MTAIDYILGCFTALLLAVASPFIREQAVSEPPRAGALYWEARGYSPLPQNSLPPVVED